MAATPKPIGSYQEAYVWCINQWADAAKQHDRLVAAARAAVDQAWGLHVDRSFGAQCKHVDVALIDALRDVLAGTEG